MSTSTEYQFSDQVWLAALAGSHMAHYLLLIALLLLGHYWLGLGAYLLRILICWPIAMVLTKRLGAAGLGLNYPALDLMLFFYYLIMAPAPFFRGKGKW